MKRRIALFSTVSALALVTAACGGSDSTTASSSTTTAPPAASSSPAESMTPSMTESMSPSADTMAGPVGPGCADYAKAVPDGEGSVDGMAKDPVAVAASNNPLLKTLVAAVSGKVNPKVDLVDTLNGGEFTVFAPVDAAFAKDVDAKTLGVLKKDAKLLTSILTYHVVAGQLSPEQVVGSQKTVQGGELEVAGSPEKLTVNGKNVICGGVKTANATVYLLDTVLMPAM